MQWLQYSPGSTTLNCMANKEGVNGKLTPPAIWHGIKNAVVNTLKKGEKEIWSNEKWDGVISEIYFCFAFLNVEMLFL